jgi:hypothetical protein
MEIGDRREEIEKGPLSKSYTVFPILRVYYPEYTPLGSAPSFRKDVVRAEREPKKGGALGVGGVARFN